MPRWTIHLDDEYTPESGRYSPNYRNGKGHKTIKGDLGEMETETLRDHKSTFPPQIGFKRLHRVDPLDEAVMVLHA